jgi:hypothetical protein
MADPTRWLNDAQASPATVELLRALEPPQAAPRAVQTALAAQLSTLVAQGGAKAAAGAMWLKAVALTAGLASAATGVVLWQQSAAKPAVVAAPPPLPRVAPAAPPSPSASAAPNEAQPEPSITTRSRAVPPPASAIAPRDKLAEEEALLEQARAQAGSSPSRALQLLKRHQAQFPSGQLSAERMYLSVDCLSRLGLRAQAEREAKALIARYPNSAYARRAPLLLAAPRR